MWLLYDDRCWCRIRRSVGDDGAACTIRSPVRWQRVVSLIVIAGVCTADGEAAADDGAENDEEDDPAGNRVARTLAAVVAAVVTLACARSECCGDDEGQDGEDFE